MGGTGRKAGGFCVVSVDTPTEMLTIAKWEKLDRWHDFIKSAKLTSMRQMHELGTQRSSRAYVKKCNFTA
jgi:hypothetical protein